MDFGPFSGTARAVCPTINPNQKFEIYNNFSLYVYDPTIENEAPTVALKNNNGNIKWCIFVEASENLKVSKLRFSNYLNIPFFWSPRVRGRVQWTHGDESMLWFINSDGELKEYWFSW
jgi:hypothetical protein